MSTAAQIPEAIPNGPDERKGHPAGRCLMVIFGASGDLTKRKLIPALYNLERSHYLPQDFAVVGFAVDQMSEKEFRQKISNEARELEEAPIEPESWNRFIERLYYIQGDCRDSAAFERLRGLLSDVDRRHNAQGNYLFYLAVAPSLFSEVIRQLGRARLVDEQEGHWRRVVIEKPFGHDLQSSIALNREITKA